MPTIRYLKVHLKGEAFWVKPIAQLANGHWRCRVSNNLYMWSYRFGDIIDVSPEMIITEMIHEKVDA